MNIEIVPATRQTASDQTPLPPVRSFFSTDEDSNKDLNEVYQEKLLEVEPSCTTRLPKFLKRMLGIK